MSYVDEHLMPGETILYRAQLHWAVFLQPILWSFSGICLLSVGVEAASFFGTLVLLLVGFPMFIDAFVARRASEFAVTNKRVLVKTGLIRRRSSEILLNKIEGIGVDQSILGRILDYGTIVVSGTGGSKEAFQRIADPMQCRQQIQKQIAATRPI